MGSAQDELVDDIWTPEKNLPSLRSFIDSLSEEGFNTAMQLLSRLAIAFNISEHHLKSLHNRAENESRLLRYPAIPASDLADGSVTRIAEHAGFGTITMLFQDSVGGLKVEDRHNQASSAASSRRSPQTLLSISATPFSSV